MVLQAVREDRMPGGRNSGAVYNLYKVGCRNGSVVFEELLRMTVILLLFS